MKILWMLLLFVCQLSLFECKYDQSKQVLDFSTLFHYSKIMELINSIEFSNKLKEMLNEEMLSESDQCINDTLHFLESIPKGEYWAIEMLDAYGKLPSGVLTGATHWTGSFSQCRNVTAPSEDVYGLIVSSFSGQYCTVSISFNKVIGVIPMVLSLGLCLPNTCSSQDMIDLTQMSVQAIGKLLNKNTTSIVVQDTSFCHKPWGSNQLSNGAIVILFIISIFVVLIVTSTLLELYQQWSINAAKTRATSLMINGRGNEELDPEQQDDGRISPNRTFSTINEETPSEINDSITRLVPTENVATVINNGIAVRILLSFSLITNVSKLFNTNQTANSGILSCVHGIRFISLSWVILGHTFAFAPQVTNNIVTVYTTVFKQWTFGAIANATVSVDSFFVLSGLLTAYLFFREIDKLGGPFTTWKTWVVFYLHRYWRLTPPYLLFMGCYVTLFNYIWDGPLWPDISKTYDPFCLKNWWTNALYLNNLINSSEQCMAWAWYLANDMQFYILSPLLMIPLYYSQIGGWIVHACFLLASMIATGVISTNDKLGVSLLGMQGLGFIDEYIKPWTRMGPYVIGLGVGFILFKLKCRCHMHKALNLLGWAVATTLGLICMYSLSSVYDQSVPPPSVDISALYNSTIRICWAIALGWVLFSCCTGHGGWVNSFLSWKVFIPLSRLTYCAYLVHPLVIFFFYSSSEAPFVMSTAAITFFYLGFMVASYGTAFIVSMMFEAPLLGLERVLRGR